MMQDFDTFRQKPERNAGPLPIDLLPSLERLWSKIAIDESIRVSA
jgi:hypothetical protein